MVDLPTLPPQYTPVVIAQTSQAQSGDVTADRAIGVCHLIENRSESRLSAVNSMEPIGAAWGYLQEREHRVIDEAVFKAARATLVTPPEHGVLEIDNTGGAAYFPATLDYFGPDRATVLVEIGGLRIKLLYFFKVMQSVPGGSEQGDPYDDKRYCPNGREWKISINPDTTNAGRYTFGSALTFTGYQSRHNRPLHPILGSGASRRPSAG